MRGFPTAVLAVAALGLQSAVRGEPPAPAATHLVTVDVIATDARGRTLDDLKPGDFELREEGAVQTLEGGRFVRAAGGPPPATLVAIRSAADERLAATRDEARVIAIFMDEYHVSAGASTERASGVGRDAAAVGVARAQGREGRGQGDGQE